MGDYGSGTNGCELLEYVIVVGSEDYYMTKQKGNWMMFMAQAVRYCRIYGSSFDLTTVFYFQGKGHTAAQVAAFTKSVKAYGAEPKAATTWSDVANHINTKTATKGGATCQKRVQVVIFFAHGSPGKIWLSSQEGLYFTTAEAAQVDAGSFVPKKFVSHGYRSRHGTSWACQTGNSGAMDPATLDQVMAGSLAQSTANTWDIEFRASVTRTEYTNTWAGRSLLDWKTNRYNVDEAVWEDDGADGPVFSSTGSAQADASKGPSIPSGMFQFNPGQTSGYRTLNLD